MHESESLKGSIESDLDRIWVVIDYRYIHVGKTRTFNFSKPLALMIVV
jgi:hypothetical protein